MDLALYNDRTMKLSVSTNGFDYSSSSSTYTYMDEPLMVSMTETEADYQGNIDTEIIGLHFTSDVTSCVFGTLKVNATYNSTSKNIKCTAPPYDSYGNVQMQLIFNGNYVVNNTLLYFTYIRLNLINDFNPRQGHLQGGLTVKIDGNFTILVNQTFQVYFGAQLATNVTLVSIFVMEVVTPSVAQEIDVKIYIHHNGEVYDTGSQLFSYKLFFQLKSIFPTSGPSRGNSVVQFTLDESIYSSAETFNYCEGIWFWIFGTERVPAITINVLRVDWKSPTNSPGDVEVNLAIPGIYETDSNITYTYNRDISVLLVNPVAVPLQGGTEITVNGLNFLSTIKFKITESGNISSISEFISSSQIKFIAPRSISTGEKLIYLSNNEQDYYQRFDFPLLYYNGVVATTVLPTKILIGSDTNITIFGSDFIQTNLIKNYLRINQTIIQMEYIDSKTLTCTLPGFDHLTTPTEFELFLTLNLQNFYGGLMVEYILKPVLASYSPTFSSSHESFFSINITGENFAHSNDLQCYIGEHKAYTILFQSSENILWFFSTLPADTYNLSVSNNNGFDLSTFSAKFEVIRSIQVTNVYPKVVMKNMNTTGASILVTGSGFKIGVRCVYEVDAVGYTFDKDNIVPGKLINSNKILCPLSNLTLVGSNDILVKASLSDNLRLISQSSAKIKLVDKAPKGFYFHDQMIMEWPKGSYCPGKGRERAIRCPIGYYTDQKRSSKWKPWNHGIWVFEGLQESIDCPKGYVCDSMLLHFPHKPCTRGHFWNGGVRQYNKFNPSLSAPVLCGKQSYWEQGAKTGVVYAHNNTSGQIWKRGFVCTEGSSTAYGIGECPTGHYCPQTGHPGIPCPPRTYCPGRGNLAPRPCQKGTYNYHYGQSNCTYCPIGYIWPFEGLFAPVLCPRGFVWNEEGLQYPFFLCQPGLIWNKGTKSGVKIENRTCKTLENIENSIVDCADGTIYLRSTDHTALYLKNYGLNYTGFVWCWDNNRLVKYIPNIAKETRYTKIFEYYALMFEKAEWDGLKITEKALFRLGFNNSDTGINIPHRMHQRLIEDYFFTNMYSKYNANLCPGGFFCLEGVYSYDADEESISTPFICPGGSYWMPGSGTAIGTGFWPAGFYWPEGSTEAIPTPPGSFTPTAGSINSILCYPGYFTLNQQSKEWLRCPNGFQCKGTGTSWPTICPVGHYRSSSESNACSLCPIGTYSIDRGIKDESECISCPQGRLCSNTGLKNITESDVWSDGAVWQEATGSRSTLTCPQGFFCPSKTGMNNIYSNMCPSGFYCGEGTGDATKFNKKCPEGYYCPAATQSYDDFLTSSTTTTNEVATRCPRGTGNDSNDGKKELIEWGVDQTSTLLQTGDIRADDTLSSTSTSRRNLFGDRQARRELQTTTTLELEQSLKDITKIEISLHRYLDSGGSTTDSLTSYINLNREYLTRWDPINSTYNDRTIFEIPALSFALVTIDLRHLQTQYHNFTYYEDWGISFTIGSNITDGSRAVPVEMPEMFLRTQTSKNQVLEFQIFAWETQMMRVDILLYNGLYFNMKSLFTNWATVEIKSPSRANAGQEKSFVAILKDEYSIGLPINSPPLQAQDTTSLPSYTVSFASNNNYTIASGTKNRIVTERGKNIWVPSSLYWQSRETINLPYLPYFSNWKGYGQYIPIWAVTEVHSGCDLVSVEDTVFMHEYSFRQKPKADKWEDILIQWVYDEVWSDDQQSLKRWFEVGPEESLFDFSVTPISAGQVLEKEFGENEVLTVAPEEASGDLNTAPRDIGLGVFYYQYSKNDKLLITVEIEFGGMKTLTDDEKNGNIDIAYNLTFNYAALSHTQLTIAFAFKWHFYLVLYLIIGILSIIIVTIFLLYHRLVARGKGIKFKFFSNLKLIIPPAAYGITLAHFPLIVINLFIAILMVGKVLTYKTELFPWDSSTNEKDCPFSLFDFIKDDPNAVSIDYKLLRSGRAGLAFCIVGAYLMYIGLKILIPEKGTKSNTHVPESYDRNVWEFFTWKRSNVLFVSLFWIFYNLMMIQFSFSETFSTYIWIMIGVFKILGIIFGFILENFLEEALLSSPMEILGGLTQGLVTFGADDFVDFLNAYFIELGIQMFERTYFGDVVDLVVQYLEARIAKLMDLRLNWFSNQDELLMSKDARKHLMRK